MSHLYRERLIITGFLDNLFIFLSGCEAIIACLSSPTGILYLLHYNFSALYNLLTLQGDIVPCLTFVKGGQRFWSTA